jgi:uncharacterized LabA/DUF88 family protein
MSDKVAVFIDGGYLDKTLQDEFNQARIDYEKLVGWMSRNVNLFRAYYYNCLPYQSDPPTPEERLRFSNRQSFYNKLSKLPKFEVRYGKLEPRGKRDDGSIILTQKRVDIQLGVDLVLLAAKQRITHVSIFTGDSDFLPAISVAKNEGVAITLFHGKIHKPHDDLWEASDERIILTQPIITSILRTN